MGDTPKIRRTLKSRGAGAGPHKRRDPYPTADLPNAPAPGELSDEAQDLVTAIGRLNWLAELAMSCKETALSSNASQRDRTDACRETRSLLAEFREEVQSVDSKAALANLTAKLTQAAELMGGQSGGVVRRDSAPPICDPEGSTSN